MPVARSIVLPAYNEEAYIEEMVDRCVTALNRQQDQLAEDTWEVLVIDNCSNDRTAEIVDKLHETDPRIRIIRHDTNKLYAGSCQTGAHNSVGERVFIMDSDGQIDPEEIWKFDAQLDKGFDVVFGKRVQRGDSRMRLLVSKIFLLHARVLIDYKLGDVNTGIRAMTRDFADALELKYRVNLANPEMYVRAKLGNFRIGEVEITQHARQAGVSSHQFTKLWDIEKMVVDHLLSLRKELKTAPRAGVAQSSASSSAK